MPANPKPNTLLLLYACSVLGGEQLLLRSEFFGKYWAQRAARRDLDRGHASRAVLIDIDSGDEEEMT